MKTIIAMLLIAAPAAAQVNVTVRTSKPEFLAGEPIFVLVEVTNIGSDPVGYSDCDGRVTLAVPNGTQKTLPRLTGCSSGDGRGGGSGCGSSHLPILKPGASTTFRYLLSGYRLRPGTHELRVAGKAGVRWRYYGAPPFNPPHKETDPLPGQMFDVALPLIVKVSSQEQLEAAYAPYVEEAQTFSPTGGYSRAAIFDGAPPFLASVITELARRFRDQPKTAGPAAAALGEINTSETRAALIKLFDESRNVITRVSIAHALAGTGHPDNLPFFASLLPGRSTELDDQIRRYAALGIGRLGGDAAVETLRLAPPSPNPLMTDVVIEAIGNTRSRFAVPLLIDRAMKPDGSFQSAVCGALMTLTHRSWCDGSADVRASQAGWRSWWGVNGPTAPLYGPDECLPDPARAPAIP